VVVQPVKFVRQMELVKSIVALALVPAPALDPVLSPASDLK